MHSIGETFQVVNKDLKLKEEVLDTFLDVSELPVFPFVNYKTCVKLVNVNIAIIVLSQFYMHIKNLSSNSLETLYMFTILGLLLLCIAFIQFAKGYLFIFKYLHMSITCEKCQTYHTCIKCMSRQTRQMCQKCRFLNYIYIMQCILIIARLILIIVLSSVYTYYFGTFNNNTLFVIDILLMLLIMLLLFDSAYLVLNKILNIN